MRMIRAAIAGVLLAAAGRSAPAQERRQGHPKLDQKQIDAAIQRGVAYLKANGSLATPNGKRSDELLLWTFVHAGVSESDANFQKLFKDMMARDPDQTYHVSLQAMILEELDRVKYQHRIWQCAQFLVDNECANGQWNYGSWTDAVKETPTPVASPRKPTATRTATPSKKAKGEPPVRVKPEVRTWLRVTKRREGAASGDNSNTQYAALGLRACHDSGILLPEKEIALAEKWWREAQEQREGKKENRPAVATGGAPQAPPEGWSYGRGEGPWGSMTAGAVGALIIYDYIQGKPWKSDADVLSGMSWMTENFTVTENPKERNGTWHYYYLYALERAGILYGTDYFGIHDWYLEGAQFLLGAQRADGSWLQTKGQYPHAVWDTCFAILFLKRACAPVRDVASVDSLRSSK